MLQGLRWLKTRLSHVKETTWHFRLAKEIWGSKNLQQSKACTYYWFKLPVAAIVLSILMVVLVVISVISSFLGFIPVWIQEERAKEQGVNQQFAYPYKHLPSGRRLPFAIWEIVVLGAIGYGLYYSFFVNPEVGMLLAEAALDLFKLAAIALGILLAIGVLTYLLWRAWKTGSIAQGRANLKAAWDRTCPPLVVEKE